MIRFANSIDKRSVFFRFFASFYISDTQPSPRDHTPATSPFAGGTYPCPTLISKPRFSSWTIRLPGSQNSCAMFCVERSSTSRSRASKPPPTLWKSLTIWTKYPLSIDSARHPLNRLQALDKLDPGSSVFRLILRKLQKICITRMRIPISHFLPNSELRINGDPVASGGFSDVFRGRFRGQEVCVKRLRVSSTGGPEKVKKGHITPLPIICRFLMIPTDVSRGHDMETVNPRQRRPVYRCNFRPPPDCIGMDVGRESDCSHNVEPAHEQDLPCEYSPYPPTPPQEIRAYLPNS